MTTVSDTDIQVFANLANPSKTNIGDINAEESSTNIGLESEVHKLAESESDEEDDRKSEKSDKSCSSRKSKSSKASSKASTKVSSKASSKASDKPASKVSSKASSKASSRASSRVSSAKQSKVESLLKPMSYVSRKSEDMTHVSKQTNRTNASERSENTTPFDDFLRNKSSLGSLKTISELPLLSSQQIESDLSILDKQQVLMDMERLKLQGVKITKEWTINDRLDDMQFEVRRHMLHIDEMNNINMMRDGMRLLCSGFEMVNGRLGILELDGWGAEVCQDMEKYDNALGRIYRKYWRKSSANSPEMEIAFGLIGSIGMHHFKSKMQKGMFQKKSHNMFNSNTPSQTRVPSQTSTSQFKKPVQDSDSDSDSDESAPP